MKREIMIGVALLVVPFVAHAQSGLNDQIDQVFSNCAAKVHAQELKTRFDMITCMNDGMEDAYKRAHWPYMASFYKFAATSLLAAADADAGKITQEEYQAKVEAARLVMAGEAEGAYQTRRNEIDQQQEAEAEAVQLAQQQRRAAIVGAFLGSGGFRVQPYQLPMPARPTPRQSTSCTTSYIGNQAYTNCQ